MHQSFDCSNIAGDPHHERRQQYYFVAMAYTFRIHCRASDDHSLALIDGQVVLAAAGPGDDRQASLPSVVCFHASAFSSSSGVPVS